MHPGAVVDSRISKPHRLFDAIRQSREGFGKRPPKSPILQPTMFLPGGVPKNFTAALLARRILPSWRNHYPHRGGVYQEVEEMILLAKPQFLVLQSAIMSLNIKGFCRPHDGRQA